MTSEQLREFLRHPDAEVRSFADWARELRGEGWRHMQPSERAASLIETRLQHRLDLLRSIGVEASPLHVINGRSAS